MENLRLKQFAMENINPQLEHPEFTAKLVECGAHLSGTEGPSQRLV
jgi:hypothetical protein